MAELNDILNISSPTVGPMLKAHGRVIGNAVSPAMFGAAGDGVTDDTTAIQSMMDYVVGTNGARVIDTTGATYLLSSTVTAIGSVNADWGVSKFIAPFSGSIFSLADTLPSGPYPLTSDYTLGTTSISVESTGTALPAGTRIRIVSDAVDPANRDLGSSALQYRVAEWAILGEGSTTTNLVLTAPLRFTVGISPDSIAGDEARVSAFTIDMDCRVIVMSDVHRFIWRGGVIDRGTDDTSMKGDALQLKYYRNPIVEDARVSRNHSPGISLIGTMCAQVIRPKIENLTDNLSNGNYGYGVADAGYLSRVSGGVFRKIRHAYTTAENTAVVGSSDMTALSATGRIVGGIVSECRSINATDSAFDTHAGAEDVSFIDCYAEGGAGFSFATRGRNVRVIRPKGRRMTKGLYLFTEYVGTATDPDYFTAGKTVADFTSVMVDSPDIQCQSEALSVGHATVTMSGVGRLMSQSCAMGAIVGAVTVAGNWSMLPSTDLGAVTDTSTSALTLSTPNSAATGAFATTTMLVSDGGRLEVDARQGAANPINLTGGTLSVFGAMIIGVPDSKSVFTKYANFATTSRGTMMLRAQSDKSTVNVNISVRSGLRILWDDGTWVAYAMPSTSSSRVYSNLPVYADNATAVTGGLLTNQLYRTSTGAIRIVV